MTNKEKEEALKLANDLLNNPELGYKEFKTKEILKDYFKKHGIEIENECFNTAFSVSIGEGHPHIGLIAELDALPTLNHPLANKLDNAAHSCGHFSQCANMAIAFVKLKQVKLKGKITLFFTPAEEYTDLKYREELIKKKKIKYIGGKINMLEKGLFDDCDLFIHLHAMSEGKFKYSIGSNLAGFVYKKITFVGKAAHAAVTPYMGVNALNAYALFNDAMNMLRETFKDEDTVRVHGYISEGGQTINAIPERVVYECYVRSCTESGLLDAANKIDNAAKSCAKALGAKAIIKTSPGYLPLIQNGDINKVIYKQMLKLVTENEIEINNPSMAAGDIGDISIFKPCVQFGYAGFTGVPHGKNFMPKDDENVYFGPIDIIYNSVLSLIKNPKLIEEITANYKPRMSKKEYMAYINGTDKKN